MSDSTPDAVQDTPLGRAARLLDAVSRGPLRFSEAQQLLGDLAPSSLNRLLKAMLALGMLERTPDGTYAAGPRLVRWQRSEDTTLRMLAGPVLEQLITELDATVIVTQRAGDDLVVVDRRTHDTSPALMKPGAVRPISIVVPAGALFMSEDELKDERELRRQLDAGRSQATMANIRRVLLRLRQNGHFDDKGVLHPQIRRISCPIRKEGEVVAAVTMGCFANRGRDHEFRHRAVAALQRAAKQLEDGLRHEL